VIAYSGDCVTAVHGRSVDDTKFLDLSSSLDSPVGARFIMGEVTRHKTPTECDRVRMRALWIKYLQRVSSQRSPGYSRTEQDIEREGGTEVRLLYM
jgi:hypothetical protein